jgi:hypothetical protein
MLAAALRVQRRWGHPAQLGNVLNFRLKKPFWANSRRVGFPHGMLTTHADVLNNDLLAFIQS